MFFNPNQTQLQADRLQSRINILIIASIVQNHLLPQEYIYCVHTLLQRNSSNYEFLPLFRILILFVVVLLKDRRNHLYWGTRRRRYGKTSRRLLSASG